MKTRYKNEKKDALNEINNYFEVKLATVLRLYHFSG